MSNLFISWIHLKDKAGAEVSNYNVKFTTSILSLQDNIYEAIITGGYSFGVIFISIAQWLISIVNSPSIFLDNLEKSYEEVFPKIYTLYAPLVFGGLAFAYIISREYMSRRLKGLNFRFDVIYSSFGLLALLIAITTSSLKILSFFYSTLSHLIYSFSGKSASDASQDNGNFFINDFLRPMTTSINYHLILSDVCNDTWSKVINLTETFDNFKNKCLQSAQTHPQASDIAAVLLIIAVGLVLIIFSSWIIYRVIFHFSVMLWTIGLAVYIIIKAIFKHERFEFVSQKFQPALSHFLMTLIVSGFTILTSDIVSGLTRVLVSKFLHPGDTATAVVTGFLYLLGYIAVFFLAIAIIGPKSNLVIALRATPPQSWSNMWKKITAELPLKKKKKDSEDEERSNLDDESLPTVNQLLPVENSFQPLDIGSSGLLVKHVFSIYNYFPSFNNTVYVAGSIANSHFSRGREIGEMFIRTQDIFLDSGFSLLDTSNTPSIHQQKQPSLNSFRGGTNNATGIVPSVSPSPEGTDSRGNIVYSSPENYHYYSQLAPKINELEKIFSQLKSIVVASSEPFLQYKYTPTGIDTKLHSSIQELTLPPETSSLLSQIKYQQRVINEAVMQMREESFFNGENNFDEEILDDGHDEVRKSRINSAKKPEKYVQALALNFLIEQGRIRALAEGKVADFSNVDIPFNSSTTLKFRKDGSRRIVLPTEKKGI